MSHEPPYPVFAEGPDDRDRASTSAQALCERTIDQDSTFARKLLAGMAIRLHGLIRDVETYSCASSTQRVIGYLLRWPTTTHPANRAADEQQVIASRLNLTPETLSHLPRPQRRQA